MRKDWKYIAYLFVLGGLLALVFLTRSKQFDWSVTYSHLDKDPFGTYVLNDLIKPYFKKEVKNSYKTFYELKDSVSQDNILIIATGFSPDQEDTKALLRHVYQGAHVFISAEYMSGLFADTLGIRVSDSFFQGENKFSLKDTISLHFVNRHLDTTELFHFKRSNARNYYSGADSTTTTVIAKNDFYQPVTLRVAHGKGSIVLNCTPLAFTNIYMLSKQNHKFISHSLSYLPEKSTYWTEFYHLGRMESATPLRFILRNEPLRWGYYIMMGTLLLFILFEAKRKQRIIPIIEPLANTTLEFVGTIGNLYYQRGDHKNIAQKKIQFFFDYIHTNYFIKISRDQDFVSMLSRKTGVTEKHAKELVDLIADIEAKQVVSKEELKKLNSLLEKFQSKN